MGLDIYVNRFTHNPEDEYNYVALIDDDGNFNNEGFPDWTNNFIHTITEDWYDWDTYKKQTGIDRDEMDWCEESYDEEGCFMTLIPKGKLPEYVNSYPGGIKAYNADRKKLQITIDLEKVPTKKVEVKVLYYNIVGYQRKGLNYKFYDDYNAGKIGYCVWTKAELERYKKNYCDGNDAKVSFQENIIDKFKEGTDCVTFSW